MALIDVDVFCAGCGKHMGVRKAEHTSPPAIKGCCPVCFPPASGPLEPLYPELAVKAEAKPPEKAPPEPEKPEVPAPAEPLPPPPPQPDAAGVMRGPKPEVHPPEEPAAEAPKNEPASA